MIDAPVLVYICVKCGPGGCSSSTIRSKHAENIAEVLQGLGFETDVAASAEAGLEKIRLGGVAALITDSSSPVATAPS